MRIVLSNLNFAVFAGTESYTLTVSRELERLGHETTIYATNLGPMAEHAASLGARVVNMTSQLPEACDAVIAQDAATAYQLAEVYPEAVRLFVMHSRYPLQSPPRLSEVCACVVVMNERLRGHAERLAGAAEVVRLRQPVDLVRFSGRRNQPRQPRQVLSLSNYRHGARERMLAQACAEAGFVLSRLGAHGEASPQPEHAMAGVDIVVSLGRGAIEAMAAGRAVYVLGPIGGDGWVTPDSYPALEADGFSGRATETIVDLPRLVADLNRWHEQMGDANRDLAWAHHDGETHATELVDLISRLRPRPADSVPAAEELARLVRMEWHASGRAEHALTENQRVRAQVDQLAARVAELTAQIEALRPAAERADSLELELRATQTRLATLLNLRRYRFACRLAWPLDRLRALRRAVSRT